ncbi:ATP-binding protein, partial [Lacticaseibacillus paracasei]
LLHNTQLKPLINDVVANQRNGFINKRLSFKLNGDDQTVLTDNKWLRFILAQLISNAVKYTPEGGRIQATIRDTGKETQLMIIDNGIGIPKDEQHRVFEKGFTGSNGR